MSKRVCLRKLFPSFGILLALFFVVICAGVVTATFNTNKLSGEMVTGGHITLPFQISPGGQYTVFGGDVRIDEKYELFRVRTLGGERVLLSPDLPADCQAAYFWFSPDGQHVVYYAVDNSHFHCGLYAIPIEGGSPVELDGPDSNFKLVQGEVTGDSANVVFVLRTAIEPYRSQLYSVPIEGGTRQAISEVFEGETEFRIDPSGAYAVYLQSSPSASDKLFRNNLNDSSFLLDEDTSILTGFQITPDSQHVVYRKTTANGIELFSVQSGGGMRVRLNETMVMGGMVNDDFKISSDSVYVVYRSDQEVVDTIKLYQVPVDGGASPVCLTSALTPGGAVTNFEITPTKLGSIYGVVYMADQLVDNRFDLFSISIEGGPYLYLNSGMIAAGDVEGFKITPNSLIVVFIADGETDEQDELYAVVIFDNTLIAKLNGPLVSGGDVKLFKITHSSLFVVYVADQDVDEEHNLYSVPIVGGEVSQLNPEMVSGGDATYFFEITTDDKGVVYIADQETDDLLELFVTYDYQMVYLPLVIM